MVARPSAVGRTSIEPSTASPAASAIAKEATSPRCSRATCWARNISASSRVYGTGIRVKRTISGSWQIPTTASTSSARQGRSVTTPSVRVGVTRR